MRGKIAHTQTYTHITALSLSFFFPPPPFLPPHSLSLIQPTFPKCLPPSPHPTPLRMSMLMDKQMSYGGELPQWFRNGARWMKGWRREREGRATERVRGMGSTLAQVSPLFTCSFLHKTGLKDMLKWKRAHYACSCHRLQSAEPSRVCSWETNKDNKARKMCYLS